MDYNGIHWEYCLYIIGIYFVDSKGLFNGIVMGLSWDLPGLSWDLLQKYSLVVLNLIYTDLIRDYWDFLGKSSSVGIYLVDE